MEVGAIVRPNVGPYAPRNALNAVTFLPGVNTTGANRNSTVNGLPESMLNITIDGVSTMATLDLRVDYLRLHYTFASGDPFKTAMGFGASSAAMNTLVPLIDGAFIIKQRDIGTSFDFLSDKPSYDCWITLSIQVWELVYIGSALGLDFLKLKLKQRRENRKRKE